MMIILPNQNTEAAASPHPGTFWMAIFSISLILLMLVAVGLFILRLRYRARNPLPDPTSLGDILETEEEQRADTNSWEKESDWWKRD